MGNHGHGDDAPAAAGMAAFAERLDVRDVDELLGFAVRRTRDPQVAADLTAETFAAALAARRRYRPAKSAAGAWLYGIALETLVDAQRRGGVEPRAQRRLGMERIAPTDRDLARIDALGEDRRATLWIGRLTSDGREAARQRTGGGA
jgi:RNA polymerase sigma-70 factor, ECF subfamily